MKKATPNFHKSQDLFLPRQLLYTLLTIKAEYILQANTHCHGHVRLIQNFLLGQERSKKEAQNRRNDTICAVTMHCVHWFVGGGDPGLPPFCVNPCVCVCVCVCVGGGGGGGGGTQGFPPSVLIPVYNCPCLLFHTACKSKTEYPSTPNYNIPSQEL